MNNTYTPQVLAIKCPVCSAVGKCLQPKRDGHEYMETPHLKRVILAEVKKGK